LKCDLIIDVITVRGVIAIEIGCFCYKGKKNNNVRRITSNLLSSLRRKIKKKKTFIQFAKNLFIVYHLPRNAKKCLGTFKKMIL